MSESPGNGNGNGASVNLPGGVGGNIRGPLAIVAAFGLLVVAGGAWIATRAIESAQRNADRIEAAIVQRAHQDSQEHKALERSFYVLACVLSYSPELRGPMRTASSLDAFVQFCPWVPADRDGNGPRR